MDNRAIGVFDSGLGGLTAVRELRKVLPDEKIIYFGDTGRVPYGTRSAETIAKYASQDMNFLLSLDVKMIVAACGTVSSNAKHILDKLQVPHTNIVDPCSHSAVQATKNGKIGIIATAASINSKAFERKIKEINSEIKVFGKSCPLLVTLVENGFIGEDETITNLALEHYLTDLKKEGVDTLILGCTHYPILAKNIAKIIGENVVLINSGEEIAKETVKTLTHNDMLSEHTSQKGEFFVSDSVQNFSEIAEICLGEKITEKITKIDIDTY